MRMVPEAGLEPAHPKAVDFESTASTDFATQALSTTRKTLALYLANATTQDLSLKIHLTAFKIISTVSGKVFIGITRLFVCFTTRIFSYQ